MKNFFNSRIPNYKVFASIYKIFLTESEGSQINPAELVTSKCSLLEHLTSQPVKDGDKEKIKDRLVTEYKQQGKDLRLLSYKILVEKFNKKYSVLSDNQRLLLKANMPRITEKIAKIKVNESLKQMDKLVLDKKLSTEDKVVSLMRYYELNQELDKIHSGK